MSPNVRASSTLSILLLSEHILMALKWLAIHYLYSMECVYHVGFDMGVLIGPKQVKTFQPLNRVVEGLTC
jgi:hypothetical protein